MNLIIKLFNNIKIKITIKIPNIIINIPKHNCNKRFIEVFIIIIILKGLHII